MSSFFMRRKILPAFSPEQLVQRLQSATAFSEPRAFSHFASISGLDESNPLPWPRPSVLMGLTCPSSDWVPILGINTSGLDGAVEEAISFAAEYLSWSRTEVGRASSAAYQAYHRLDKLETLVHETETGGAIIPWSSYRGLIELARFIQEVSVKMSEYEDEGAKHSCLWRGADAAALGRSALRRVPVSACVAAPPGDGPVMSSYQQAASMAYAWGLAHIDKSTGAGGNRLIALGHASVRHIPALASLPNGAYQISPPSHRVPSCTDAPRAAALDATVPAVYMRRAAHLGTLDLWACKVAPRDCTGPDPIALSMFPGSRQCVWALPGSAAPSGGSDIQIEPVIAVTAVMRGY